MVDMDWFRRGLKNGLKIDQDLEKMPLWKEQTSEGITLNKCISPHSLGTRTHWNVIYDVTNSILTTSSWTRINTFVSRTCLVSWTIIIDDTFWSTATIVRITLIFRWTWTYSIQTLSVRTTRWWITRVIKSWFFCYAKCLVWEWIRLERKVDSLTWGGFGIATCEGVSSVTFSTRTNWCVIDDIAICIDTAWTRTRISTFLLNASFIAWTFWVYWTFRSTIRGWTHVIWQTSAWWWTIVVTTLWERPTRWWLAGISVLILSGWYNRG